MRSEKKPKTVRWLTGALVCLAAICSCDDSGDGANVLSLTSGGLGSDSAVVHARVTFPGFDQQFDDYGKSGPVYIPVVTSSGTIRVQFSRIRGQADTIGKAELSMKIARGNGYSALFVRLPANSPNACFGCSGDLKFPMTGSAHTSTDSMHVLFANARPLCKGCVAARRDSVRVVARAD